MARGNTFTPTDSQLAAIKEFAAKAGRTWKSQLATAWQCGADAREPMGSELRQIRNSLGGPAWVHSLKLGS